MKKIFSILIFLSISIGFAQNALPKFELWAIFIKNDFVDKSAHKIIAKKWHLELYELSDNVLESTKMIDSIYKHNQKIWQYLNQHGHQHAEMEFMNEVIKVKNEISKAVSLSINKIDLTQYKIPNISYLHSEFYTEIDSIKTHQYRFSIYNFDYKKKYTQTNLLIQYTVDINTEKIKIIKGNKNDGK